MTVLITRPTPDGEQLTQQLNAAGIKAIAHPLLTIEAGNGLPALISQLNLLQPGDFLIAVSVHAVNLAHNYILSHCASWPKNVHYIAVGQKTAAALQHATGQAVSQPIQRSDSEGLLALPELAAVNQRRVVILRGNGGRELIHQTLTERGAEVEYCECYRRSLLPLDGEQLCQQWQAQGVSALVVTSGEQLAHLCAAIPPHAQAWFYQCQLYVPSQRIADQAQQLGFIHFSTVGSAANQALFTFLSKIGTMG
ncbi:uroporphyrinogen III synthase [Photobacterium jeanii]|uniref:Uroporphyrinogen-III synthase n=1 Tax=Photobacterium jeanii TaxID=858640 RepID=A0A178KPX9_9GAMM|nr:uroporphyrinogen-III synthase [Photobacterium jeanii]OAN19166.1 uroporphyrinogen III synthase [Photobacterium jeanii]PST87173.1 uroporphyrinogen-III synthase [Photobacterium jeanii]